MFTVEPDGGRWCSKLPAVRRYQPMESTSRVLSHNPAYSLCATTESIPLASTDERDFTVISTSTHRTLSIVLERQLAIVLAQEAQKPLVVVRLQIEDARDDPV